MKIIYKKEQEVKLGDVIDYYDANITLTQDFIDRNTELFQVEEGFPEYVKLIKSELAGVWHYGKVGEVFKVLKYYKEVDDRYSNYKVGVNNYIDKPSAEPATKEEYDKQELFLKAKEKYPIGTKFKGLGTGKVFTTTSEPYFSGKYICVKTLESPLCAIDIYRSEQWTEILKPIGKYYCGTDIFEQSECYVLMNSKDWDIFKYLGGTTLGLSYKEVFKTKQEAEDYKYNWQPVLTRTDIYNLEQYLPDNYWHPIKGIFNLK